MPERFVRRTNARLFVNVSGDGPALVFAHGLFGSHADGKWLADSASGFTLITWDLRGRGRSSPARSIEEHSFDEHAADLAAILQDLDVRQAVIIGSSFGAGVAVAFALGYPNHVRALVLIASAFGAKTDPMGEGNLSSYGALAERIATEGLDEIANQEAKRAGSSRPVERWARHDEASLVAWLRAVAIYRPFQQISDLQRIIGRALVVPGGDGIHTRELSESLAASLPHGELADEGGNLSRTVEEFLRGLT